MQIFIEGFLDSKDTPIIQESVKNHTSSTPVIHQANSEKIYPKYQNSSQNIDRFSETSDHKYNWLNSLKDIII